MSNYLIPSLETLPVEIIHRIFDSLDAQTILSSVRGTCRRLQALVNSYDRFILNFKQISKPDFELICRLIEPQNVISLTVSHDNETLYEIEVFISRFHNEQFSRVRSLTLIGIEQRHFKSLLKYVNINFLISFSLKFGNVYESCRKSTTTLLSSVIAQANLRQLEVEIPSNRTESSAWLVQCMIQHLRIGACQTFDPSNILRCSPVLKTLVLTFFKSTNDQIVFPDDALTTSFRQLNSLTLENISTKVETLEMLLSLVPSLTHFKLIGTGNFLDGNRWEHFIQMNLPFLSKFEFSIQKSADTDYTREDIESIITSFQTPFWVEHKKWFVTGEYNIDQPRLVQLYSIPICISSWIYQSASKKVSLSTSDTKTDNEPSILNNITAIQLNFQRVALNDIPNKTEEIRNPLFRKVENLELDLDHVRLLDWTFFISTLIDLTKIIQIKLPSRFVYQAEPLMVTEITSLLRQTCNLSSLDLCYPYTYGKPDLTAEDICLMTPSHVRHLAVPIKGLNEIKIVLERLDHLSSVKFSFQDGSPLSGFIKWLKEKWDGSSYHITNFYMCAWLGKKHVQPKAVNIGAKRIKLTDEHQDS